MYNYKNNQNTTPKNRNYQNTTPKPTPVALNSENYVDIAEKNIESLCHDRQKITTSKIRHLFSMVANVYNKEMLNTDSNILESTKSGLQTLRVKTIYEAGRSPETKNFISECNILEYLKDINNERKKFVIFFHYFEALVAYHKYLLGDDNRWITKL